MTAPTLTHAPVQRQLSLDVLRGITIAFMIMVNNNGGDGSWGFMNHSAWNGLTATDVVSPTFLFVVGVSIVFAFEARLARGTTRAELTRQTVRRAGILFLMGIVVNAFPIFELAHLRIYGVLQRIGICYLVVGLFYLWDKRVWTKVVAVIVALVGYWIMLRWVPVPGAGMPGRDIPFLDQNMNLPFWLDRQIFPYHLALAPPDYNLHDEQGLLSDITSICSTLMGVFAGLWLLGSRKIATKTKGLAMGAVGCLLVGYLWAIWFPINKNLWTSTFVLVAAGWSLTALMLTYWAVEQRGWGKGSSKGWTWPWLVFGSNAIVAYMLSSLVSNSFWKIKFTSGGRQMDIQGYLFAHSFAYIPNPGWATFAYSISFTLFCFIPAWILYRKKIFVKV